MARQLWLLRHADAEPHGTRQDSERRLTERGERQARLAGAAIARMGVEFEALLSSPKERALRTATVAAQAWSEAQRERLEIHAPLAGGFDARQALAALEAMPARVAPSGGDSAPFARLASSARSAASAPIASSTSLTSPARLLIVGHEPDLSTVVAELTGARIDLKKGGLAVVRLEGGAVGRRPASRAPLRPDDGARAELLMLLRPSELALIAD